MPNPGKSLLNITLLNTMGRLVFFAFVFLTGYFTSRALTKDAFGAVQYLMLWVNIGWIVFNFGIPNILSRYFTQALINQSYDVVKRLIRLSSITAGITSVIGILILIGINSQSEMDLPYGTLILLVISSVGLFYLQILVQAMLAYRAVFLTNVIAVVSALSFLLYMLPHWGAMAYIYTYIIANGLLSLGYFVVVVQGVSDLKKRYATSAYQLPERKVLLKNALYFGGSAILAGMLWQRYELSLLKYSVPFSELANYIVAFSVLALVIEPLKLIPSALIYYFAGLSGDEEKASEKFAMFFRHFCWLVFFIGVFVFCHAETIVSFFYTAKYAESAELLKILLVGMIPGTCSYVMMNMHVGLGRSRFLVFQDTVGVVVFASLLYLGNTWFGLVGAAWAKSISVMLSVSLGLWYTSTKLQYHVPYGKVVLMFVLSLMLIWSTQAVLSDSIVLLAVKGMVLFVVYVFISLQMNLVDRSLVFEKLGQAKAYMATFFR